MSQGKWRSDLFLSYIDKSRLDPNMTKKISLTDWITRKSSWKIWDFFFYIAIKVRTASYPAASTGSRRRRFDLETSKTKNISVIQQNRPHVWAATHIYSVQIPFEAMLPSCAGPLISFAVIFCVVQTPNTVEGFRPYPRTRNCRMLEAVC